MDQIPVFKPLLEAEEVQAVVGAVELGWLGMGSYVGEFESAVAKVAGAGERPVVAVSTGHAAIHLALLVAGVGPGDEVITPSFNNMADFQAILATGASPVFCDIDPGTLCIDLDSAERLIGPRTKVIIATDFFCHLADHARLAELARANGLRVVHDAAHSFGSRWQGKAIGSFSDITIFSFDAVKAVTCIDGGAIIVQTEAEAQALREMRLIGMGQPSSVMYQNQRAWTYDVVRPGFRYHLANLHAALGLSQIEKIELIGRTRRDASRRYGERLGGTPGLRIPHADLDDMTPFLYYVRVPPDSRAAFREHLRADGIDTGIHWQPGHWFTLFKDLRRDDLPVTDQVGNEIVSLPLHSRMAIETVDRICDSIATFFR